MDEFEQRISDLLEEAVPGSFPEIDVEDVRGLARPRHRSMRGRMRHAARRRQQRVGVAPKRNRRLAIAGSIAIAAAIAAGSYALAGGGGGRSSVARGPDSSSPSAIGPTSTTDPAELTSASWQLTRILDASHTVPSAPSAPVVFTFENRYATDHVGDTATAHIAPGRIEFGGWANDLIAHPGPSLDIAQTRFVYSIMDGMLDWSISGDALIMVRHGQGSLVFERTTYDAKQAYGTASGRFMAVGGPANVRSPRPLHGTGTVQLTDNRTGQTRTVDTATDGSYSVSIAPGTYVVTGRISTYQSGHALCMANKPVVIDKGRTAEADVYCQER